MAFGQVPALVKALYPSLIWKLPADQRAIYLTFDDGPIPEVTEWVLDQLNAFNAKATFFCVGENVEKNPSIYQRILREGHCTGNHTFNHLNGWKTRNDQYYENIERCSQFVNSNLYRPPYGKLKRDQIKHLKTKFKLIMWDVLPYDFSKNVTEEECLAIALKYTQAGSIVVFHDNIKSWDNLSYALPKFLKSFTERGYEFRTLDSLNHLAR